MTDINEIKRELEALTAKVAAYEATKARNWPERIEAGMCFEREGGAVYMAMIGERLVCLKASSANTVEKIGSTWTSGGSYFGAFNSSEWAYLGRYILTIRTDAHEPITPQEYARAAMDRTVAKHEARLSHEPTGAELVGRVCEFSDDGERWESTGECERFDKESKFPYKRRRGFVWTFARLAK